MNRTAVAGKGMLGIALGLALLAFSLPGASSEAEEDMDILDFETMFAVSGPFVGSANPIRGVNGGGLPWMLTSADGELETDGTLKIDVKGLVLADDPAVPEARRGINPSANFRGLVNCLTMGMDGSVTTMNVSTGDFPATPEGDATIEETLMLPMPCVAPIIFVTNPSGSWFAVTGH